MKTSVIDNYIDTINEAVNWVGLWTDPVLKGGNLVKSSILYGKDLHQRVFELSPYEIKDEILKNSTIENIKKYSSFFAKRLEVETAAVVFPFGFDDIMSDSNNEYRMQVFSLVEEGCISQAEANTILRCIALIVREINLRTEMLQGIFAGLRQCAISSKRSVNIPNELTTEGAVKLLNGAIEGGLCDIDYKWLKSKALLAYFADRASDYLGLCKGEYEGKPKTSWKPFETLFGISGLSVAKRDFQNTGSPPIGCCDVDKLFE